jgi:AraC family ethanolamine operon transcriptional activator
MDATSRGRRAATGSRQQLVERAEAYMRAHVGRRVPLAQLSRQLGLSERGLRNAFYDVRGVSPRRAMLAERLEGVRRALSRPDARPATVTGAAIDFGFYELGRFAAAYRQAYGEAPSDTLRGTSRNRRDHPGLPEMKGPP